MARGATIRTELIQVTGRLTRIGWWIRPQRCRAEYLRTRSPYLRIRARIL